MNKNPYPLLLLLLVVVGGVVIAGAYFLGADSQGPEVTPVAWLEDDPAKASPFDPSAAGFADGELDTPDSPPPEGFLEVVREVEAVEEEILEGSALVVQVLEGETGGPAAEADVFMVDGFEGPELGDPFAQHWSDLAESRGQRFQTDLQGRVELPPVQDWAIVTARRPGAYGFAKLGLEHREVETITLQPDETVTVQVLDGEDRPVAEVPVGVIQRVPVRADPKAMFAELEEIGSAIKEVEQYIRDNPAQREDATEKLEWLYERAGQLKKGVGKAKADGKRPGKNTRTTSKPAVTTRVEVRAMRRTDPQGIAVFRHFQLYRHQHEEWWPPQWIDQFEAALLMPMQRPETRAFTGNPVPGETLVLRMPPTGSIALRTVDLAGQPFLHPVHADLRMVGTEVAPWTRAQVRKEQDESAIVFPFVGLGLQFTVRCRLDDDDFRWDVPQFAGPSGPGERVTLDLVVAPDAGMLTGRLLDLAGEPLAGVRPTFLVQSEAGRLEGEEVTLDAAGRFHLPYLVEQPHQPPFRLEIRRNDVRPTAGLAMTLEKLSVGRVTDLGDLRIDSLGQVAYGAVVDDRGEPIAQANVQLQREREVGGKRPRLEYVDESFAAVQTDAEGYYELFAELEPGRYRLRAEAKEHFPADSPELRRGEAVDLVLERKSRVVGTVLTPPWMPNKSIRVQLESALDPQQRREDQIHDFEGRNYIFFDWVRPGIYNVLIRTQGFPDPFLRVDGLEVVAGQQGLHPRLQDLDLGTFLYRFDVGAVDEAGQPIRPKQPLIAQIVRPDGRTAFVGFAWRNRGRAEIFGASPVLDVWPMAPGYVAQRTTVNHGQSEVRFLRIPPVDLHLPGMRQLVGTIPVYLSMTPVGDIGLPGGLEAWDPRSKKVAGWYGGGRSNYVRMDEDDTARIGLMRAGRYQLVAHLWKTPVELDVVDVELKPGTGPERVTVRFDPERIRAALAEAEQLRATWGK